MELIFQPSDGDQFTMEVGNSDTILQIKIRIQELIGILLDSQTLIFDGDILPDHLNLRHSQIGDGSTIDLHLQRNDPELQIELDGILSNYSLILSSPISDQAPALTQNHPPTTIHQQHDPTTELCVILHQSPTLILENSPSSIVRSVTSSILQLDADHRISRINRMIPRPGERPTYPPCFHQTLSQTHAGADNQPPFTLLRRQHCFHYSTRTAGRFTIEEFSTRPGADVENCASSSTHQSLTLTVERPPCPAAAGGEPRIEIRFVCVLYEAGRFTVMLRAYIHMAAIVEVPPSSTRLSFIGHLLGLDISDQSEQQSGSESSSVEEHDSNRGKGVVREDMAESSGTSADGNGENRSAAAPHRRRTVHDVVSGREIGCRKGELIVVVMYRDQRCLVVVRHLEQVLMLRERLVQIHFRLPRPIYIFLHRHRIMDEHLTFEHNLVEHGDCIQPFPAFIL